MHCERAEYEKADGKGGRSSKRMVKLPGGKQHAQSAETAAVIARRISVQKAEKRLEALKDG